MTFLLEDAGNYFALRYFWQYFGAYQFVLKFHVQNYHEFIKCHDFDEIDYVISREYAYNQNMESKKIHFK